MPLSAFLFDALHLDGADLIDRSDAERRVALAGVVPAGMLMPRLVTADVLASFDEHCDAMVELSTRLFGSAEAQEGMRAFLERRPPSWAR